MASRLRSCGGSDTSPTKNIVKRNARRRHPYRRCHLNLGEVVMAVAARLQKPEPNEYAEYYGRYTQLVPEGDVVATLEAQGKKFVDFLRAIPEAKGTYRY